MCNDGFDDNSADAICRVLGYKRRSNWTSGQKWEIQSVFDIHMDYVKCVRGDWSSCTYSESPLFWCDHSDDVFLVCSGKLDNLYLFTSNNIGYLPF